MRGDTSFVIICNALYVSLATLSRYAAYLTLFTAVLLQVGLISDSTLMELLDSALSANIVNTVRSLKTFHESGVEPLNLISQLASLITRILAGGYHVSKRKLKSKFFRSKECKFSVQAIAFALKMYIVFVSA